MQRDNKHIDIDNSNGAFSNVDVGQRWNKQLSWIVNDIPC